VPGRTSPPARWAGALSFCRELSLVDEAVVSQPAAELDRLRRDPLPPEPNQPFTAAAYDVELPPDAGRVELWLIGAR
jgi:beta-fructofuranosidase